MRCSILHSIICCVLVLVAVMTATAQSPYQTKASTLSDVEFYATNYGIFGLDIEHASAGFTVPRGSGLTYVFGAGLWFGAMKKVGEDTNKLVFITYNPNTGSSWAVPDGVAQPATAEQLYHSVRYDKSTGRPLVAGGDAPWPLWILEEAKPRPADPGYYETDWSGRRKTGSLTGPAFLPGVTEQFTTSYNDRTLSRYEYITFDSAAAIGYPLGLRVRQHIYAWGSGPFKDVVMIKYEIENRSSDTLFNCVASQMTDTDIGVSLNDHASFFTRRPDLRAAYAWTEPEGSKPYKVLATAIVEGPVIDERDFIDDITLGARKRFKTEGRVHTFQSWMIEEDPTTITQRYEFMSDRSQHDIDYGPGDRRMLMGTAPFHLRPLEVAHFTVVYAVVDARPSESPGSGTSELETLLEAVNDAYYERESFSSVPANPILAGARSMRLLPNPARDRAMVRFTAGAASEGRLRVMSTLGEEVMERDLGRLEAGPHEAELDLTSLPSGLYLVSVTAGSEMTTSTLTVTR